MKYVASVSWGKDSLAMLHILLDSNDPLDEVVFYDTGAEFNAIYQERDSMLPLLKAKNINYVELKPREPFFYQMFAHPAKTRKTGEIHYGYGWCGGSCRWGTAYKNLAIENHLKKHGDRVIQYVGLAADEQSRMSSDIFKCYPLNAESMTEADCLKFCYERGHEWLEDGVRLYDVLDRVSCWCCRNKNFKELQAIHDKLPKYWKRLCALEATLGQMKSKPLSEIVESKDKKVSTNE